MEPGCVSATPLVEYGCPMDRPVVLNLSQPSTRWAPIEGETPEATHRGNYLRWDASHMHGEEMTQATIPPVHSKGPPTWADHPSSPIQNPLRRYMHAGAHEPPPRPPLAGMFTSSWVSKQLPAQVIASYLYLLSSALRLSPLRQSGGAWRRCLHMGTGGHRASCRAGWALLRHK